jgi:hypothetical protein
MSNRTRRAQILVLVVVTSGVGSSLAASSSARVPPTRRVPCGEASALRSAQVSRGRRVLGMVVVPPRYLPQVVKLPTKPWRYWTKAGIAIRAGSAPVGITVPVAWRDRAAIVWGNGPDLFSSLRIDSCASQLGATWNGYAGGFYLQARSACVPLIVRVGARTATVRFGIGRRC